MLQICIETVGSSEHLVATCSQVQLVPITCSCRNLVMTSGSTLKKTNFSATLFVWKGCWSWWMKKNKTKVVDTATGKQDIIPAQEDEFSCYLPYILDSFSRVFWRHPESCSCYIILIKTIFWLNFKTLSCAHYVIFLLPIKI